MTRVQVVMASLDDLFPTDVPADAPSRSKSKRTRGEQQSDEPPPKTHRITRRVAVNKSAPAEAVVLADPFEFADEPDSAAAVSDDDYDEVDEPPRTSDDKEEAHSDHERDAVDEIPCAQGDEEEDRGDETVNVATPDIIPRSGTRSDGANETDAKVSDTYASTVDVEASQENEDTDHEVKQDTGVVAANEPVDASNEVVPRRTTRTINALRIKEPGTKANVTNKSVFVSQLGLHLKTFCCVWLSVNVLVSRVFIPDGGPCAEPVWTVTPTKGRSPERECADS